VPEELACRDTSTRLGLEGGGGVGTGSAADLEHLGAPGELDVAKVGLAHGALLRVGGSQLQDLGDLGDERRVGIGDGRVYVSHLDAPFSGPHDRAAESR
jgi:hypothetical protein